MYQHQWQDLQTTPAQTTATATAPDRMHSKITPNNRKLRKCDFLVLG